MSTNKNGVTSWVVALLSVTLFTITALSTFLILTHYSNTDTPSASGDKKIIYQSQPNDADDIFALLDMSSGELNEKMSSYSQTRLFSDENLISHVYCSSASFCTFVDNNHGNATDACGVYAHKHILYWSIMCKGSERDSFTSDVRAQAGEYYISLGTLSTQGDTWDTSLEPRDFAEGRTPNVMRLEKVLSISSMDTSTLSQTAQEETNCDSLSLSESNGKQSIFNFTKGTHQGQIYFTDLAQGMDGTSPVILMVVVMS